VNGIALYFLPSYAIALGKIPGASTLLGWSGLGASDVSVLYATTKHDGVGLTVTAGFAGDSATVLAIEVAGPGASPGSFASVSLTDQFGHSYSPSAESDAVTNLPDGATPDLLTFAALTGPAATVGARLTLQASDWSSICACDDSGAQQISGTWLVTFVLVRHPAHEIAWAPVTLDGVAYTFPSVTVTGGRLLQVQVNGAGQAVDAMPRGTITIASPRLEDSAGRALTPTRVPGVWYRATDEHESFFFDYILRPGRYSLFVYGPDGSSAERDLVVE
jgi:hypothetical protein